MKPWLWLPPQLAHDLSPLAVQLYSLLHEQRTPEWRSFNWKNLHFKNRLGLAGGVDKNGDNLSAWERLGAGFIELGAVTPEPQKPNSGKIFDRSLADQALWNKMGFPSCGADESFYNLKKFKSESQLPVLVNIGKNRDTSNEHASRDYIFFSAKIQRVGRRFRFKYQQPQHLGIT